MGNTDHKTIINEILEESPQNICSESKEITNSSPKLAIKTDLVGVKNRKVLRDKLIQEHKRVLTIEERKNLSIKTGKIKKKLVYLLSTFSVEIPEPLVYKIIEMYISYFSISKNVIHRSVIMFECLLFIASDCFLVPNINTICKKLEISKATYITLTERFIHFCYSQNIQSHSDFYRTHIKSLFVFHINKIPSTEADMPDIRKTAIRLIKALDKLTLLSVYCHSTFAHAIINYIKMAANGEPLPINYAWKYRKFGRMCFLVINSIIVLVLSNFSSGFKYDPEINATTRNILDALDIIEKTSVEILNSKLSEIIHGYRNKFTWLERNIEEPEKIYPQNPPEGESDQPKI